MVVSEHIEDFFFPMNAFGLVVLDDVLFVDGLDSKQLGSLFVFGQVNIAKSAFAYLFLEFVVVNAFLLLSLYHVLLIFYY